MSFVSDLVDSQYNSIDAFLEWRPEYHQVGKLAIASAIADAERPEKTNGDWFKYLWNLLNTSGPDRFSQNKVAFITFNYDRSLEYCLGRSMKALTGRSYDECRKILSCIPIIHLHGSLGALSWSGNDSGVRYGESLITKEALNRAADSIRIVHDDLSASEEFLKAQEILSKSENVFCLGFGYHPLNCERIKLRDCICDKRGTAYKLTTAERDEIRGRTGVSIGIHLNETSLDLLRDHLPRIAG